MSKFPSIKTFDERSYPVQLEIKKWVELPTETIFEIISKESKIGKFGPELIVELSEEDGTMHKVWCPKSVRLALEKDVNINFIRNNKSIGKTSSGYVIPNVDVLSF